MDSRNAFVIRIRFLLLAMLAIFGTGCAHQVHLSQADYASLRTVTVTKTPGPVKSVFYYPVGKNIGVACGGIIGAAIAESAYSGDQARLKEAMDIPDNNPARITGEAFARGIQKAGLFPKVASQGDAVFVFNVQSAGLGIPHGFSSKLKPQLVVQAQLASKDGKVLWEKTEKVGPLDRLPSDQSGVDFPGNPSVLKGAFESAADVLVSKWIADLQKDLKLPATTTVRR